MNAALYKLWLWFWHLIPANPILVRVVYGNSRRQRHLWLRAGYLAVLLAVVVFGIAQISGGDTLADLAKGASKTFKYAAWAQLALMCFLAPIFAAGAITQEKDSRTYNILLTTPLSNAQIVLGSLMSRLFFVIMLLVAGLPIFFTTMIYGGVTAHQIIENLVIAGSTAILAGSLAISISMIKVGTRRTIFSFYLMIALYLSSLYALGLWNRTWVTEAPPNVEQRKMSWLAPYHPFLCLEVALNQVQAPDLGLVRHYGSLDQYLLAYPSASYVTITLVTSLVLVIVSMFFVRSSDKEGEVGPLLRLKAALTRQELGERRRRLRHVWSNPVAWREAATRASAVSRGLMRYVIIGGGSVAAVWLLIDYLGMLHNSAAAHATSVATTQVWLSTIVMIEYGLVLLVATNTAATAITKEREANTMDLLTATPLTSAYIVKGKLRGLVSYVVPLIAVPTGSILLFGLADLLRGSAPPVVPIEAGIELAALMITFSAVACVWGLYCSLIRKRTVQAVMLSVGFLVLGGFVVTLVWGMLSRASGTFGAVLAPATPFTALELSINPVGLTDRGSSGLTATTLTQIRIGAFFGTAISAAFWFWIVWMTYGGIVRNFDMTIRKQSAQL
ncbi:MAG TPA: ABC transporter permease subunit [Phycisphaerae bacterium]